MQAAYREANYLAALAEKPSRYSLISPHVETQVDSLLKAILFLIPYRREKRLFLTLLLVLVRLLLTTVIISASSIKSDDGVGVNVTHTGTAGHLF